MAWMVEEFISDARRRELALGEYVGGDGRHLAFKAYLTDTDACRTALVYLHGLESHAGWFDQPARLLRERGFDMFLLDRRGSGINRENRGFDSGHADSPELLFADIHAFIEPLRRMYDAVVLIGLSWGGKLATGYVLAYPGFADALVLITPGLRSRVDVSISIKAGVLLGSLLYSRMRFPTPLAPELFTDSPAQLQFIANDPLRLRSATARFFMVSRRLDRLLERGIERLNAPVLVLLADRDLIIDNDGVVETLGRAKQARLEVVTYSEQSHAVQLEIPERVVDDIVNWLASLGEESA